MSTPPRAVTALRCAAPGLLLAALALLPFFRKAYTIDDSTFLLAAQHALSDPLHPTAFDMPSGGTIIRVSRLMVNGPVMSYLLVPAVLLGGAEWAAHAVQLLLFCLAIFGTCLLALRLGLGAGAARWAGALVATAPAALVMASTSMADTPALAFGVLGMERLWAWRQERRTGAAVAAAILLALSALSRPHLGLLLAVGALLLLVPPGPDEGQVEMGEDRPYLEAPPRPRLSLRALLGPPYGRYLPLLGAAALTLLVIRLTSDPQAQQRTILHATRDVSTDRMLRRNLAAHFGHFTFTLPLALPWLLLHPRRLLLGPLLGTAVALMGATLLGSDRPPVILWMAPAAGLGLAAVSDVLLAALRRLRDRGDVTGLVLWSWLLISLPVVLYVHLPAKYVGASAPAAALLLARGAARLPPLRRRLLCGGAVGAGLLLSVLIIKADANMVNFTRAAAEELIRPGVAAGRKVWFDGGWGFRWYALRAGGVPLALGRPLPQPGDLIVSARQDAGPMWLVPRRRLLRQLSDATPGGRIMSQSCDAGYYSNGPGFGYLPWAWGKDPIETFSLWEIQ